MFVVKFFTEKEWWNRPERRSVMTVSEIIAYAIKKECSRYSLMDWCKWWGFSIEQFNRFLQVGVEAFDAEQEDNEEE